MSSIRPAVALLLLSCLAAPAMAMAMPSPATTPGSTTEQAPAGLRDAAYYLQRADQAQADGRDRAALRHLHRAGFLASKPAQARVAQMLWQGTSAQAADRPAAHAWMAMAAERGDATLQATRQAYWAAMSPAEQALSLAMGERLRRHYGDAAALARAEGAQRRHAGRRIGLGGFSGVEPSSSGPALVTPHHLVVAAAPTR